MYREETEQVMGRPTKYTPELADRICERIATSELGLEQVLAEILEQDGTAPTATSIYRWLEAYPEFREQSARARRMQAELLHDRAQIVAQTPLIGIISKRGVEKGKETDLTETSDNIERSKLIVQTMLRRAGQLDPKKYGEKLAVEHDVSDSLAERIAKARAAK